MKLAIMQPYFFPYIGYWQLIHAADTFVLYDDVNYIKRGWINRNRLLENGKAAYFNVLVQNASQNKHINETKLFWEQKEKEKLLRRIEACYRKALYFHAIYPLIEELIITQTDNLAEYLEGTIKLLCKYLEIKTDILISSDLKKDNTLHGQDKIIHICKVMKADTYLNAIGGQQLYDKRVFQEAAIELFFLKSEPIVYSQLENNFVENLSIIDMLMFCGKEKTRDFLDKYKLM